MKRPNPFKNWVLGYDIWICFWLGYHPDGPSDSLEYISCTCRKMTPPLVNIVNSKTEYLKTSTDN